MTTQELQSQFHIIKDMYLKQSKSSQAIADFFQVKRSQINYILKE